MSCREDREASGRYVIRVLDAETGHPVETTWASSRNHCALRLSALQERYDTPGAYIFETEEA